jgi:ketose-bisphosphate aldolase
MDHAEREKYAVGYFECWNLESLMAVIDAAEATHSPVLVGFSGIYLPHPDRVRIEPPSIYAAMGLAACVNASVPAGMVFNESPHLDQVLLAIQDGYDLVMFSDEDLSPDEQIAQIRQVVDAAHKADCAVEGEAMSLPGVGGDLTRIPEHARLTDLKTARHLIEETGIDAFAVNIGQMHFHGRRRIRLSLELLSELSNALNLPLVLHGASSVHEEDIEAAIQLGIRKVNVGSILKQTFFEAMRDAALHTSDSDNPYEVIGSGLAADVLIAGRVALQEKVTELMVLFGSAGKADSFQ